MHLPDHLKRSTCFFVLLMGMTLTMNTGLLAQPVTVAVLDFEGFGISETEAVALSNRLRNELFRLGTFQVVDRGMMENILMEQDFQLTGCTSNDCLVQVGQLVGAKQMVGGSVSKVGGTFTVSARLVDVETGTLLGVSDFDLRGELDDMLTRGMRQVALMLSGSDASSAEREAVATTLPVRQVPPPVSRQDIGEIFRSLPWQALVGKSVGEGGIGLEITKFIGQGWPLGLFLLKPAVSMGYLMRTYEDVMENYYEDKRGYLSMTAHGDMEGKKFGGGVYLGLGLGVGEYWEGYYDEWEDDYVETWYTDDMETVFILGAQVRAPIAKSLRLVGDVRIVSTPTYEASFLFEIGLQR